MVEKKSGWLTLTRRGSWLFLLLASTAASYLTLTVWRPHGERTVEYGRRSEMPSDGPPTNPFASAHGRNLLAFVITASDCGWSALPSTMSAVSSIRARLNEVHAPDYAHVTVIGIALDADLGAGLQFLAEIEGGKPGSAFDQIMVGGDWLNEQIVRFVWRQQVAAPISPQVIVVARQVDTDAYMDAAVIGVSPTDSILVNPVGSAEILQWLEEGVPLDFEGMPLDDKPLRAGALTN